MLLFKFPYGNNATDQRSGDGFSVDDVKSSCSFQGYTPFPDFELLDARIASVLNNIIQNPTSRKISPRSGRQIAYLIYDYFWVTGVNESVLDCADLLRLLFEMTIIRSSIQDGTKFYFPWNNSPPDDILASLYKFKNMRV